VATRTFGGIPFRRAERKSGARGPLQVTVRASREVRLGCRALWVGAAAGYGFPAEGRLCLFPCSGGATAPTVPRFLRAGLILSCLVSSTECLRSSSLSPPFGATRPAWVSALFAASPAASTNAGAHLLPLRSALRFLQPLDGLLRLRFCGLVASRCHVQGSLRSGVSPDSQLSRLVAGRCPLAVGKRLLTGEPAATTACPDFGALFRGSMRASGSAFNRLRSRSPLRCSVLLQAPANPTWAGSPDPPLVTFPPPSSDTPKRGAGNDGGPSACRRWAR
jgi:hypothetical protein